MTESAPRLEVVLGDATLTPGQPASVTVTVRNLEAAARVYGFVFVGVDEEWTVAPGRLGPLAPGQAATATFIITLPAGFPATDLAARLDVEPRNPTTGLPVGPAASVDTVLPVGDGATLTGSLDPSDVRGRERGRVRILLHNRGRVATRVELTAASVADSVLIRFTDPVVVVEPGEELVVRATLRGHRPRYGKPVRRPFVIRAQGRSTPLLLDGSFTQRAVVGSTAFKIGAVVAVVGLWIGLALLAVGKLSSTTQHKATAAAQAAPAAGTPIAGGVTSQNGGSGAGGSASGGAGAGAGGAGAGASGAAMGAPGGGSSGGGAGAAGAAGAGGGTSAATTEISGKVMAPDPSGVTVALQPTSLVTEAAAGGATSSQLASATVGKIQADVSAPIVASSNATTAMTLTSTNGAWAFTNVATPGYYRVTFSKAGYQAASYVVTTAVDNAPITLNTALSTATGSLGGSVFGPAGLLGGVDIAITNGMVTLNTQTPTTGKVGTWSVSGLSTPGTYLVTATEPGFATQTALETLTAGGSNPGVALTMPVGVASITGTVTAATSLAPGGGVGGITVAVTGGTTTLTATTSTDAPVGSYTIPNLAIPGTYSLTVSGAGWVTQTEQVQLNANDVVNAVLTPTTGNVTGTVTESPNAANPAACDDNPPITGTTDLNSAGLVLANGPIIFKTLSTESPTPGGFSFDGIPPGHYTLTATAFEYGDQVTQVDVTAGATTMAALAPLACNGPTDNDGSGLTVTVASLVTGQPISGPGLSVTADQGSASVASTAIPGTFTITGLSAGLHQITAKDPGQYEPTTVTATVGVDTTSMAPPIRMPVLNTLSGTITSNAGGPATTGVVTVFDSTGTLVVGTGRANAQGQYQVTGLPHGSYLVYASGSGFVPSQVPAAVTSSGSGSGSGSTSTSGPGTTSPSPSTAASASASAALPTATQLTIPLDTDEVLNFNLDQLPILNVTTLVTGANGNLSPLPGVSFSLASSDSGSSDSGSALSLSTGDGGQLTIPSPSETMVFGLGTVADSYTLSGFSPPSGDMFQTCELSTASALGVQLPSCSFTPALNQTYSLVALFTDFQVPAGGVQGSLAYPVRSRGIVPVPASTGAVVSMTGLASYAFGAGGSPGVPSYHTYTTGVVDPTGAFTFPNTDVNLASTADFLVNQSPAFQSFTDAQVTTQGLTAAGANAEPLSPFELMPVPTPISGTVTLFATPPAVAPPATVTAVVTEPNGTLSPATVTVDGTGKIIWNDPVSGAAALPDTYDITFTAPGYDPTSVVVTVGLCATSPCPTQSLAPIVLNQQATITASAVDGSGAAVNGATFTLFDNGNPVGASVTAASGKNTASFPSLTLINANYSVTAVKAGYSVPAAAVAVAVTPGCACTTSVVLDQLGTITGTVQRRLFAGGPTSAGAGASVSVTPAPVGCTYGATADASGSFTITGGTTTACQGLGSPESPGPYTVTASLPGYAPAAASSVSVTDGATTPVTLTLVATPITVTGTVTDTAGPPPAGLAHVTVTAVNGVTGAPTTTMTATDGTFSLTLAPVVYAVNFTLPGYGSVLGVPLDLVPTVVPPPLTIAMTKDLNTLSGATTAVSAAGTSTPLPGVTVQVIDITSQTVVATGVSSAGVSGGPARYLINDIPDGSYQITFSDAGYASPPAQSLVMNASNLYDADGPLTPLLHSVLVTVQSDVVTTPPTVVPGATVTLGGITQTAGTNATTTFSNVAPGVYTITATRNPQTPATTGSVSLTVPVSPTSGDPLPATVSISEGLIGGTASAPGGGAVTVAISGTASSTPPVAITAAAVVTNGTYQQYLPPGTYKVTFSTTGFADDVHPGIVVADNAPAVTVNADLVPPPREVIVTLTSAVGTATIAGARVTLTPSPPPAAPGSALSATTAADGTATFSSVPPGTYTATVDGTTAMAGGQSTPHLGQPSTATVNVVVPIATVAHPAPVLAGVQLVEGEIMGSTTGAGSAVVTVTITPPTGAGSAVTLSAVTLSVTSGTYAAYVPPGTGYTVDFGSAGYNDDAHTNVAVNNGAVTTVNANLTPLDHTVTIQVQSAVPLPLGTGLNGVEVSLTQSGAASPLFGPSPTALVGSSNGIVTFSSVPPGSYTISADGSGTTPPHQSATMSLSVPIGVMDPSTIPLAINEAEITGSVTLSGGGPGPAVVTLVDTAPGSPTLTPTLVAGVYDAFVAPGTYTLSVSANGYSPPTGIPATVTVATGDKDIQPSYTLTPIQHTATVAVVSAVDAQPLDGATVTLGSGSGALTQTTAMVAGVGDGIAQFTGVAASAVAYPMSVTDAGHPNGTGSVLVPVGPTDPPAVTVTINEVEISGVVTLQAPGSVSLAPAPLPKVTITGGSPSSTTTPTVGASGDFQEFLVPGTYSVTSSANGYQAAKVHDALTTAGQEDLSAGASLAPLTLTVTVSSAFSPRVAGATVAGTGGLGSMTTDASGTVTFSGVPAGTYSLSVSGVPSAPVSVTVTSTSAETAPLAATIALSEGEITGTVSLMSGSTCGATTATVTVTGPTNSTLSVAVGGSFSALVAPGNYTVAFSASGCTAPASQSVTVAKGLAATGNGVFP